MIFTQPTTLSLKDFIIRPATVDDAEAACDMFNAHDMAVLGTARSRPDEVRREWEAPHFDPSEDTLLVATPEGQVVGLVEVWNTTQPHVRNWVWARVHPQFAGLGIGTQLMTWAEARARQHIPKAPAHARIVMGAECHESQDDAKTLFEDQGLSLVRHFFTMLIEMDEQPPAPVLPDGLTIRTFVPNQDELATFRAKEESFKDHWGHVDRPEEEGLKYWHRWINDDPEWDPSVWFLAMDGDEIAGVSLCVNQTNEDPDMAYVAILGVRRPWRRRGLGKALLNHSFGEFYRRGKKRVSLDVDASSLTGATRLYEGAGMHVYRRWDYYEKILRSGEDISTQSLG